MSVLRLDEKAVSVCIWTRVFQCVCVCVFVGKGLKNKKETWCNVFASNPKAFN